MFIDTSALVAVLTVEEERDAFALAIKNSQTKIISGLVRLETVMAMTRKTDLKPERNSRALDLLVSTMNINYVALTEAISALAIEAFGKYGKGQEHPAQLNLSDCMSYAAAKFYRQPLLFKGNNFPKTDAKLVKLKP